MKSKTLTLLTAVVLFVALAIPAQVSAQEPRQQEEKKEHTRYKLIDLGTPGGPHSYGSVNGDGFRFLNDSGVVASSANTSAPDPNAPKSCYVLDCFLAHDFRWKVGKMTDLGALPSVNGSAAGSINARRWSTGQSENGLVDSLRPFGLLEQLRAVLWKQGKIIDLGTLGGIDAIGIDLNNRGQVVGFSTNAVPDDRLWNPNSVLYLGKGSQARFGHFGWAQRFAIRHHKNQRAWTGDRFFAFTNSIPNATTGMPTVDPFLWEEGTMKDLGTLGGTLGFPIFLNNRGQVIGQSNLSGDLIAHAFIWDDAVMTDLGTLGGDNSEAIWINHAGDVVGSADLPGSQVHIPVPGVAAPKN